MTYTSLVVLAVAAVVVVDGVILRTNLVRRKAFWTSYAIILSFQLIVNGVLTGLPVVRYDAGRDPRLAGRLRAGRGPAVRVRDGAAHPVDVGLARATRARPPVVRYAVRIHQALTAAGAAMPSRRRSGTEIRSTNTS